MHSAEMWRCLVECDAAGVRKLWAHIAPNLPQPRTDHKALATIHRARTEMPDMPLKLRAYSHRWLTDHGYPSALPDDLKPKAERMEPKIVEAVGIAVKGRSDASKPVAKLIEKAMSDAVLECFADGRIEPVFVKARMAEARARTIDKLFG